MVAATGWASVFTQQHGNIAVQQTTVPPLGLAAVPGGLSSATRLGIIVSSSKQYNVQKREDKTLNDDGG